MTTLPIRICVVGQAGEPVPQALLSIVHASVAVPEITLISRDDGTILLHLPANAVFTFRATSADGRSGETSVSTAAGAGSAAGQEHDLTIG